MCLAVPGKVVAITDSPVPDLRTGTADFGGIRKEVSLAFTPEAVVGDYVMVHVGFALSIIDAAEADRIFETLKELGGADLEVPG